MRVATKALGGATAGWAYDLIAVVAGDRPVRPGGGR